MVTRDFPHQAPAGTSGLRRVFRAIAFVAIAVSASARPSEARLNSLLIVADDLGYQDVGFQGSRDIPMHHLDRLAVSGLRWAGG